MESPAASLSEGKKIIQRSLQDMPHTPGVYRMLAADGAPLYIGKAKNLKNRVANYVNVGALNARLQRMVSQVASVEIVTTRSEAEALLLEANMVKKFSPRYNVLLKDDKSFPYILLAGDHDFPRISKHRGPKSKRGSYFGPFVSGLAVNETITLLQRAFLLRPCSDNVFKNRTRPCLQYQIKRCSAPCVGKIGKDDYAALIAQAEAFLSGKSREIHDRLAAEMQRLSAELRYEEARVLRDRIRALAHVQREAMKGHALGDADVIAMARDGAECCIQLFSFRAGRNYGNKSWFPAHTAQVDDAEIVAQFIGQLYQAQPVPQTIVVSHLPAEPELLAEALAMGAGHKVEIVRPQRGEKRAAMDEALRNAAGALARHAAMQGAAAQVMEKVQQLFGLEELPARIEVYDNSHISGTHAVGAMIVAGPEGFMKREYRTFNIRDAATTPGDDFAMLREVLTRRFAKLQEGEGARPDLVLIDGGAGQLSVATQLFEELGIGDIVYAAIAKGPERNAGREWFHLPGKTPFQLPEGDAALHYLQRLRDEAHRFAIGAHRGKRSKTMQVSELDRIEGIGPARKKALLMHFGSARGVSAASVEDLRRAPGVSQAMAERIFAHFHGGQ